MELLQLPRLCWVAFSSNPFQDGLADAHDISLDTIDDATLDRDDWPVLGQGAGGITRKALWNDTTVAVKTFFGELTSDGSPHDERAISVVASTAHDECLISLWGQTPQGALIMEFLDNYVGLAGPPSMQTCSRDVYSRTTISMDKAETIVKGLLEALTDLHARGICHGDFYGHNILIHEGVDSRVKLSEFGAAFFYDSAAPYAKWIQKIEMRAFGVLVEELQAIVDGENPIFSSLVKACRGEAMSFAELGQLL